MHCKLASPVCGPLATPVGLEAAIESFPNLLSLCVPRHPFLPLGSKFHPDLTLKDLGALPALRVSLTATDCLSRIEKPDLSKNASGDP